MKDYPFPQLCADLLTGLLISALAVLLSAIAFGGWWPYTAAAAAVFLAASVFLLRSAQAQRRRCRSITAASGYVPMIFLLAHEPIAVYARAFAAVNPAYVREYGGPNAGDGFGLIALDIPFAFMMILLAILIARKLSED